MEFTPTNLLIFYFVAISIVTFITYGIDKYKAQKNKWRIKEFTLLLLAAIGGSLGAWCGMYFFHHKTKHLKFKYGVPAIIIIQLALAIWIYTSF